MKVLLTFLLFLLLIPMAYSQRTLVKGRVVDENNQPLVGVSVIFKAVGTVTVTKADGKFAINVNDVQNGVLQLSFAGYKTQEIFLKGRDNVDISMVPSTEKLNDVIVISALGLTRKAKSIGYSTQSVDVGQLTEARDVNITNGLQGKVSGLQVTSTGQPGSSSRVVIRGENSMTGNNQPLWVIDGVPMSNDMGDTRGDNLDYGNGAEDINPDDVESIQVLKGPNATALYGSRAANGAILVTTKKGKIGDKTLGIALNQNTMLSTITQFPEYQNEYGEGTNGTIVGSNGSLIVPGTGAARMGTSGTTWGMPMLGQPYDNFSGVPVPGGYSPQPNNITSLYKTALTSTTNVSISKGDDVSAFRLSYTYTNGNDVMKNENLMQRHNLSLNATRKVGSFLTFDARVMYTEQDTKNRTYRNLDAASPMAAYVYLPRSTSIGALTPWVGANGNSVTFGSTNNTEDPLWAIYENKNEDRHNRLLGGITATARINSSLNFRLQGSGDLDFANSYQYKELGGLKTPLGYYSNLMQNVTNWDYEGMLMFNKKLSSSFTLTANLGTGLVTGNNLTRGASISSLLVHNMASINNSNAVPVTSEAQSLTKTESVYGNATLAYKDFLFLDITGRNDWSSTLPVNSASFFYPSVSGSFIFSNFIKNKDLISYGKLRASWAQVGNSAPAQSLITPYNYGGLFLGNPYITYATQLNSPNLKPEQTVSKEVGLDLNLFKNRLSFSGSLYKSTATNQIITAQTAPETGFTSRILNAGKMTNWGIELSANTKIIQSKKFNWNMLANWSMNRNMVVALVPGVNRLTLGSNLNATVNAIVGNPYGALLGNAAYKVGDTTLVSSANGRVIVNANQPLGNFHPDWIGSLGTSFTYGGFDFSVLFSVKWGGSIYSASYGRANFAGTTVASLYGRDAYLLSSIILGENGSEQQGIGQTVGTTITRYWDSTRAKGAQYQLAYFPKVDAKGNIVYDKNGKEEPGVKSNFWMNPTTYQSDILNDNPRSTFNASDIKLSQLILGYTLPPRVLGRTPVKGIRLAFVGRNLWTLFQRTPLGIDPEAANTSGNAQGIEAGGSFPTASYGFDLKVTF